MTTSEFNPEFYINVASIMHANLPAPRLRKKFVYDKIDGFVPIITVETDK